MKSGFGVTLSALRREKGLSQRSAASDLGVSQALLSHYENGAREPKLEFVVKACDYYCVTADYILGRVEDRDEKPSQLIKALLGVANEIQELNRAEDSLIAKLMSLTTEG